MSPTPKVPPDDSEIEPLAILLVPDEVGPAAPRRLPRGRLSVSGTARELGRPEDEYREIQKGIRALELASLRGLETQLAAVLTVALFYERHLRQHARARNRANDLLTAMRTLANRALPWARADLAPLREAIHRLQDDPILAKMRAYLDVRAGRPPIDSPLPRWLRGVESFLAAPPQNASVRLREMAEEFEGSAAVHVGKPWLGAIDLDRVERLLPPAGIRIGAEAVPMWAAWALMAVLERGRCSRSRVGEDADRIITAAIPAWAKTDKTLDVVGLRHRAWKRFLGLTAAKRRATEQKFAVHPTTIWFAEGAKLAADLEQLAGPGS